MFSIGFRQQQFKELHALIPAKQFRQFCCPGCGLAIENEIAVAGDPPLRDVEL